MFVALPRWESAIRLRAEQKRFDDQRREVKRERGRRRERKTVGERGRPWRCRRTSSSVAACSTPSLASRGPRYRPDVALVVFFSVLSLPSSSPLPFRWSRRVFPALHSLCVPPLVVLSASASTAAIVEENEKNAVSAKSRLPPPLCRIHRAQFSLLLT